MRKNRVVGFVLFSWVLVCIFCECLFGQVPNQPAPTPAAPLAQAPRINRRMLPQFPNGMMTLVAHTYSNVADKGALSAGLILEETRREGVRNALAITDAQLKEIEAARVAVQAQVMMQISNLSKKVSDANENDLKTIQVEFETEVQKNIDRINAIVTPEQLLKSKELIFQITGGLNSPLVNKDTLDVLNIQGEERKKAEVVIEQAAAERKTKIDVLMEIVEKEVNNRGKLSEEERKELRAKREAAIADIMALGQKTGNRIKAFLTDEQQKKSDQLLADVPDFLPKLPFAVVKDSSYIPNKDSWKPGEAVPDAEKNKTKTRRDFPRNTKEEKQEKETSQEKE